MSRTLTWEFISPVNTQRALTAPDVDAVKKIFLDADAESQTGYFANLSEDQRAVLLDFLYHIFRFAKSRNMTSEKISTLLSCCYHTHVDAMAEKATMAEAYRLFETYMIAHSVHRPPYSVAIFAVDDVKLVNDYLLTTYFRQYKLYLFAFTNRSEARLQSSLLGDVNEVPPKIPPMSTSMPLAQFEAKENDRRRKEEEDARQAEEERRAAEEEAAKRAAAEEDPAMTAGLKAQLGGIKDSVSQMNNEKLDALEAKLAALENRVVEVTKPASAQKPPARRK